MNVDLLAINIRACTRAFRKHKDKIYEVVGVTTFIRVVDYPTLVDSEMTEETDLVVDVHYVHVVVNVPDAMERAEAMLGELRSFEDPAHLVRGITYLELAAFFRGDIDTTLRLLAIGTVMGWWDLTTPANQGYTDAQAEELAQQGLIMASGFQG